MGFWDTTDFSFTGNFIKAQNLTTHLPNSRINLLIHTIFGEGVFSQFQFS